MRRPIQLAWVIALAIVVSDRLARAQSSTNDHTTVVRDVDICLSRLHEIHDEVVKLEGVAPADQPALVDCIHSRVLRITGLLELTEQAKQDMRRALKSDEADVVESDASNVRLSCARAEKLLLEAEGCATSVTVKAAVTNAPPAATTNASASIQITPRVTGPLPPKRRVERSQQTCVHQEQFAFMLARAAGLKLVEPATAKDCVTALARLAVEPLGGWQPGKCVTVDDVYVACARAMNLKVKDPQDPLSYGQALRDEGLGVDTLLPERDPHLDSPYVLDSEVRAFLISGYAAPLPSSRKVTPY